MTIAQRLRIYEQNIANLDDYDSPDELEWDVLLLLSHRDSFVGLTLSAEEQVQLAKLDEQLRAHADVIIPMLPGSNPPGRSHWWWYLHERVQVRN